MASPLKTLKDVKSLDVDSEGSTSPTPGPDADEAQLKITKYKYFVVPTKQPTN